LLFIAPDVETYPRFVNPVTLPRPPAAILLDFDGVILDSVAIKTQAYARIYQEEDPRLLAEIINYQSLHGGVTRRDKFAYFERHLFGRPGDPESLDRLAASYRDLVYEAVLGCAFVPGAEGFLEIAHGRIDLHLVSGTPHNELVDIVHRRGLAKYFATVHGAPMQKHDAFAQIVARGYDPARTLAVGDAVTEYVAASDLGIPFLGIVPVGSPNPFPTRIPVVASLENLGALLGIG
jgi:phosphoglycolate phosphatase